MGVHMRVTETFFAVFLVGCATADSEDPQTDRIVKNAISFADVTANHAAITQLGNAAFSLDSDAAASMLASEGSREVLDYLIGCAFRKTQSFTGDSGGTSYTFQGDVGLAKSWKTQALSLKQKRWVSACMFARINNHGTLMNVSLRGPHHALRVTQAEVGQYTLEEGVFYGNIFNNPASIVGWSCRGQAQAQAETDPDSALGARDCAEQEGGLANQCGWGYANDCFAWQAGGTQACEKRIVTGGNRDDDPEEDGHDDDNPADGGHAQNTYYKKCHAGGGTIQFLNPMWKEVITVYVENGPPT